jgi:hypothetical protein
MAHMSPIFTAARTPHYTMPVPPADNSADITYYRAFVSEMGRAKQASVADKIRNSMEAAATRTGTSATHIARLLVDCGLRAPRHAFPDSFVSFVDNAPQTTGQKSGFGTIFPADTDMDALRLYWQGTPQAPAKTPQRTLENA